MVTLSQLFARNPVRPGVAGDAPVAINAAPASQGSPMPVLLPRNGVGHHPHPHHLQLVTNPGIFDWESVGQGEQRGSLTPRSNSGAMRIAVTVGTETVGTLESLPAAILYDWVTKLNSHGYDIQVDIYAPGNDAPPQLLTKSASAAAHYLHTLLDH